jgi:uncharacterized protein
MPDIAHTAFDMISGMTPELRSNTYVFVTTNDAGLGEQLSNDAIATFREDEGLSLLVSLACAQHHGLPCNQPMRCITLNVYSSLEGVGLTAAVSTALADNGIACNMVAGFHHDHVFVPENLCDEAMAVLAELQSNATQD